MGFVNEKWPVFGDYDIAVVGGGPAGIGAAVSAARQGKRVVVVEKHGFPGGVGTLCCVPLYFSFSYKDQQIIGGLPDEIVRRLDEQNEASLMVSQGVYIPEFQKIGTRPLLSRVIMRAEKMRVFYHDLLEENGVVKLFYTHFFSALCENDSVVSLLVDTLEGPQLIRASVFIDATGEAHMVHRAGGETFASDPDSTMHKSMFFEVDGVTNYDWDTNQKIYAKLFKDGETPKNVWPYFGHAHMLNSGVVQIAFGYANGDGCSSTDMTRMDSELRRLNFEILEFLRNKMPGFEKCNLVNSSIQVGVRSGRRIQGEAVVSEQYITSGVLPKDPIVPITRVFGAHSTTANKTFKPSWGQMLDGLSTIPYHALVSKSFKNVLAAGRCISSDERVLGTFRYMPTCMIIGQAAGLAASLFLDNTNLSSVKDVPYLKLRNKMENSNFIFI